MALELQTDLDDVEGGNDEAIRCGPRTDGKPVSPCLRWDGRTGGGRKEWGRTEPAYREMTPAVAPAAATCMFLPSSLRRAPPVDMHPTRVLSDLAEDRAGVLFRLARWRGPWSRCLSLP